MAHFEADLRSTRFADLNETALGKSLCRISDTSYLLCSGYCCGEFWESSPSFCCSTDLTPLRNLFFFLSMAFILLFVTVNLLIVVELVTQARILERIKCIRKFYSPTSSSDTGLSNSERVSSGDTSLDEEKSSSSELKERHRDDRWSKSLLDRHSQSFKDMSKWNTLNRLAKTELREKVKVIKLKRPIGVKSPASSMMDPSSNHHSKDRPILKDNQLPATN